MGSVQHLRGGVHFEQIDKRLEQSETAILYAANMGINKSREDVR